MSEVDRLSTSGTYPALPMADRRRSREESRDATRRENQQDDAARKQAQVPSHAAAAGPKPPVSLIDEYA